MADGLYAVAPEEFVPARNALAKELKALGRKDEAAVVAKLRRPTVGAWALNQVARAQPELVAAALDAGAQLRAATEETVAGRAGALREASAAERTAANAVVKAAGLHLGTKAGAQQQALLATLRMAALDETVADQLRRGVLVADQEQGGFGFGMDGDVAPLAASPPPPKAKAKAAPKRALTSAKASSSAKPVEATPVVDQTELERQRAEKTAAREAARVRKRELAERMRTADRKSREAARLAREADEIEAEAREARSAADAARAESDAAHAALQELQASR